MQNDIVKVASVSGHLEAEILRSLLEAHGIDVWISQEAAGTAIGLGVGPLGEAHVMVRAADARQAREILADYQAGKLQSDS
jgi:hypothetical protein